MDQGPSNSQSAGKRLPGGPTEGSHTNQSALPAAKPDTQEALPVRDMGDLIMGPEATPWSRLLVQDHVGGDGRLILFQACTAGRDLVLSAAKEATLKVSAQQEVHLQAARRALVTRGQLLTTLSLDATNTWQLAYALGMLGDSTRWVDKLQVEGTGPLPKHVLAIVGHCCPKLRALDIQVALDQLPSPDVFPNLNDLTITDPTLYSTLDENQRQLHSQNVRLASAPYIKHLTHLTLCSPDYLPTLLSPANMATHLCSLDLRCTELDDELLGFVLQCAPAVEQLAVGSIALQSDVHVHTPATWRQLTYYEEDGLCVTSLARLPDTSPGLLLVCPSKGLRTLRCDTAILDDAVAARLATRQFRWEGDDDHVFLDYVDGVDPAAALRLGLSTLRCWVKVEGTPFSSLTIFGGWTMDLQMMMELATGLPRWQRLGFSAGVHWVPEQPHLYNSLLRLLPNTYCEVTIPCKHINDDGSLTPEQVVIICGCAPTDRTAEAPFRITLEACSEELFEAIRHSRQLHPVPNVVLVRVRP